MYCPIILRERSAATLSRFWRCVLAKRLAELKRSRLRLATLANPLVRGFLTRVAARRARGKQRVRRRAMLLVSLEVRDWSRCLLVRLVSYVGACVCVCVCCLLA